MINYNMIKKIFDGKLKIKKISDKIRLSQYTEYIPMYDIYSDSIYMIASENLHYRLLKCHYRFINDEVKKWLQNKMEKIDKDSPLLDKYKLNLNIIDCYDMDTLEKTSYETLYRYSPELGLSVSICKRNSFNPYSTHLTPYYSKTELINLGMNNKIIKKMDEYSIMDKSLHYKICKKVSKNDISYTTIGEHMKYIIENKMIAWVCFYSLTGSFIFNEILRKSFQINRYMYDGLVQIINTINKVTLPKDYYFYRFVWDDDYIKDLKIGGTFVDKGFMSTTRDPFYSAGIKMDFGLILLRINVPKKILGVGLLVENFSMFPKEEEFLIQPFTKFKLISKDTNTTYHHTNKVFEKLIKKKYEFNIVEVNGIKNIKKMDIIDDNTIPGIDINMMELNGNDRFDLFTNFLNKCDKLGQYIYNDMIFIAEWFDSIGTYQHMYHNKTHDGFIHRYYKDGFPILSIECGDKMVVNFTRKKYYYDNFITIETDKLNHIVSMYCKLFKYTDAIIYFDYENFIEFKDNYNDNIEYLYISMYCSTIYKYIKNKKHNMNKYYKYEYGFWQIDKIIKQIVPDEIINKLPNSLKQNRLTWGVLYIEIVEKYFYLYNRMEEWFNMYHDNIFNNNYYIFNAISYLKANNYTSYDIPNFTHVLTRDRGTMFKLIYNDSSRRL